MQGYIYLGFLILLYFLPGFNAYSRSHKNRQAIFALNFLLGWTVLGWVIALVWSLTDNVAEPVQIKLPNPPGPRGIDLAAVKVPTDKASNEESGNQQN
jgi:hypothetical protein